MVQWWSGDPGAVGSDSLQIRNHNLKAFTQSNTMLCRYFNFGQPSQNSCFSHLESLSSANSFTLRLAVAVGSMNPAEIFGDAKEISTNLLILVTGSQAVLENHLGSPY